MDRALSLNIMIKPYLRAVCLLCLSSVSLQWRHNERDGVSNHQHYACLLYRLFRRRAKKTSKLRVTGLCEGNSAVTGEFPAQRSVMRKMFRGSHNGDFRIRQDFHIFIGHRWFPWYISADQMILNKTADGNWQNITALRVFLNLSKPETNDHGIRAFDNSTTTPNTNERMKWPPWPLGPIEINKTSNRYREWISNHANINNGMLLLTHDLTSKPNSHDDRAWISS